MASAYYSALCTRRDRHYFSHGGLSALFPNGCNGARWEVRYGTLGDSGDFSVYVNGVHRNDAVGAIDALSDLVRHGVIPAATVPIIVADRQALGTP